MSRIIAIGGGGFLDPHDPLMHRYMLAQADKGRPKICLLATGKGDAPQYNERFSKAFGQYACEPAHLDLFNRSVGDLERFVFDQDIILVWGGNTASMLAVWRAHGLDEILVRAAERGVVLAGLCAGALAWFEGGVTDSFGGLDALNEGLGLLRGSHCPHYDADSQRRPTYRRLVAAGELQAGVAADVDVAIRYEDGHVAEVVSSRAGASAWEVSRVEGRIEERPMPARFLGDAG